MFPLSLSLFLFKRTCRRIDGLQIHGNPLCDEDLSIFFASEMDAVIISVDYSLAPENKFPRPFDDCYEALDWVSTVPVLGLPNTTGALQSRCCPGRTQRRNERNQCHQARALGLFCRRQSRSSGCTERQPVAFSFSNSATEPHCSCYLRP